MRPGGQWRLRRGILELRGHHGRTCRVNTATYASAAHAPCDASAHCCSDPGAHSRTDSAANAATYASAADAPCDASAHCCSDLGAHSPTDSAAFTSAPHGHASAHNRASYARCVR